LGPSTGGFVKKCASCSKDLPEAALHCVFCGAKQPPAPAVQPGLAKTAFGYSNAEMMDQLKASAPAAAPYSQPRAHAPSQPPSPYTPPQRAHPPSQPPQGYGGSLGPTAAANAATVFVQGGPPIQPPHPQQPPSYAMPTLAAAPPPQGPMGGMGGMGPGGYNPVPVGPPGGMGVHSPHQITPQPLPTAPQPYYGAQHAHAGPRPIEPWKDSLPFMMIVWGVVMLVAFATPISTDPLGFNWDVFIHGDSKAMVPFLVIAAVGLLGVVIGAIPMPSLPRGILAAALGLAGIFVPLIIVANIFDDIGSSWRSLLPIVALLTLIPGLLIRNEYTESMLARILVTVGVVAALVPLLIPTNDQIPLVSTFKALIDAPGEAKVAPILTLVGIVLVVMALLAWMPGPATGGAKVIAWVLIVYPIAKFLVEMLIKGRVVDAIKASPAVLVHWAPDTVCLIFIGYGLATVIGKQLE
jgi:hypothetical protein